MIPKKIHYCWFGRNPLPELAQKCIASWRKFFPDYEIWQWSEEELGTSSDLDVNVDANHPYDKLMGFDVNSIQYTREAYEAKKYAFVSDYARFWILYKYGGLYFDTDVEVIKPMDDIIEKGPFMGIERSAFLNGYPMVAPGLGLGTYKGHPFYREMIDYYSHQLFILPDKSLNTKTVVEYTTRKFCEKGLKRTKELQMVDDIWIYPDDFFCPMDASTGITRINETTVSIHHYDCSWLNHNTLRFKVHQIKNFINRFLYKIRVIR